MRWSRGGLAGISEVHVNCEWQLQLPTDREADRCQLWDEAAGTVEDNGTVPLG